MILYLRKMIILISGASHTGKTALAQKLMLQHKIPYFSIDHLKMGLIRSGNTQIKVDEDEKLTPYLWAIVKEMIKTAIENNQSLIVEGCYIPFDWQKDFTENYLEQIKYYCLVMTERYIQKYFDDIIKFENVAEKRKTSGLDKEELIADNALNLKFCKQYGLNVVLIDEIYSVSVAL